MSSEFTLGVFDLAILRLETVSWRTKMFMNTKMIDIATQEIIDPMKNLATSRRHAQIFIDAIKIKRLGFLKFAIIIDEFFTPTGLPLNILLEYGWSEFFTAPVNVLALHWTGMGQDFFSKGHWVRGFLGYHMLLSMEHWGFVDRFHLRLITETNKWLESSKFK